MDLLERVKLKEIATRKAAMNDFEYIKKTYGVPACIGRVVKFEGRCGVITKDRGNYIGVTFDDETNQVSSLHPTWNVEYFGMAKPRKLTRSQQRYQDCLNSAYYDGCNEVNNQNNIEAASESK
jgi:hypothetical protein